MAVIVQVYNLYIYIKYKSIYLYIIYTVYFFKSIYVYIYRYISIYYDVETQSLNPPQGNGDPVPRFDEIDADIVTLVPYKVVPQFGIAKMVYNSH